MLTYMEFFIISKYLHNRDKLKLLTLFDINSKVYILLTEYDDSFYKSIIDSQNTKLLNKYIRNENLRLIHHQNAYIYSLQTNDIISADIISTKLGDIPENALEIAGNNNSVEQLKLVQKHMGIHKSKDYYKMFDFIKLNNFNHLRYICTAANIRFDDDGLLSIKLAIKNKNRNITNLIYKNAGFDSNKLKSITNFMIRNRTI